MREQEEIGIIATTIIVAFALIVAINSENYIELKQEKKDIIPINLDFVNCDTKKLNTSVPFIIKIIHDPIIEQKLLTFHNNPDSVMIFEKTNYELIMSSKSKDHWFLQISLTYTEAKNRDVRIEYDSSLGKGFREISQNSKDWCYIFEINSQG